MNSNWLSPAAVAGDSSLAVLWRRGLVVSGPRKGPGEHFSDPDASPRPQPNVIWQIDSTDYLLSDAAVVLVVQILDDCSRLDLGRQSQQSAGEQSDDIWLGVQAAISRYGLPQLMLTDNATTYDGDRARVRRRPGDPAARARGHPHLVQGCAARGPQAGANKVHRPWSDATPTTLSGHNLDGPPGPAGHLPGLVPTGRTPTPVPWKGRRPSDAGTSPDKRRPTAPQSRPSHSSPAPPSAPAARSASTATTWAWPKRSRQSATAAVFSSNGLQPHHLHRRPHGPPPRPRPRPAAATPATSTSAPDNTPQNRADVSDVPPTHHAADAFEQSQVAMLLEIGSFGRSGGLPRRPPA